MYFRSCEEGGKPQETELTRRVDQNGWLCRLGREEKRREI